MFTQTFDTYNWDKSLKSIYSKTKNDVISALNKIIKKQNSIINKKKYQESKKEKMIFNEILNNIMKDINL